jgi:Ribbon-helix-helix protein, copG family
MTKLAKYIHTKLTDLEIETIDELARARGASRNATVRWIIMRWIDEQIGQIQNENRQVQDDG